MADDEDEDYVLQQALEALAGNVYNPDLNPSPDSNEKTPPEPIATTAARWQNLFNIASMDTAIETIMAHRHNLTRSRISNTHWDLVRAEKEAQGYDREAYEYEIEVLRKKAAIPDALPEAEEESGVSYLVEMDAVLDSPEKVKMAAGMDTVPAVVSGRSVEEGRVVWLCCIDGGAKARLLKWAAEEGRGGWEPRILVNPKSLR